MSKQILNKPVSKFLFTLFNWGFSCINRKHAMLTETDSAVNELCYVKKDSDNVCHVKFYVVHENIDIRGKLFKDEPFWCFSSSV